VSPELSRALGSGAAFLAGMYFVARAVANQFIPYSGETGFANLILLLLAFCLGARAFGSRRRAIIPETLLALATLWLGLTLFGLLRSPNWGAGVPLAADAATYMLVLLSGVLWISSEPPEDRGALLASVIKGFVAMVFVEAAFGVWQYLIDLPRLQQQISSGEELLPESLQGALGLARVRGTDVFGTFGNPNSLAAYLVAGMWLAIGFVWEPLIVPRSFRMQKDGTALEAELRPPLYRLAFFAALVICLLSALVFTHSKGGLLACVLGGIIFALQRLGMTSESRRRLFNRLILAGVALVLLLLVLGFFGLVPMPLSLEERFGYWRAALGMVGDYPAIGVGLGGFADHYAFYKVPLGKETREAHNDYLHMLAELGVLGPVLYLALWALVLRATSRVKAEHDEAAGQHAEYAPNAMRLVAAGGVVAFVLLYVAFQPFGSVEVLKLVMGEPSGRAWLYCLQTLALPALYAATVYLLPRAGRINASMVQGYRAALGAVLIHELIDFDFRAQALLTGLLLLGGMFYALAHADESQTVPDKEGARTPVLQKFSGAAVALLALLLILPAVVIPSRSGMARAAAENREDEARELQRSLQESDVNFSERNKELRALRREIAELRQQAAVAAPYDSAAWLDLGLAYDAMQAAYGSRSAQTEVFRFLHEAERLRPLAAHPKIVLGDFYLRRALGFVTRREDPGTLVLQAHAFYSAGAARYPLSPGLRLLCGDALLVQAISDHTFAPQQFERRVGEAAAEYLAAFRTDMRIDDVNVRLSGMFTDAHSAAFPRHGQDGLIENNVRAILSKGPRLSPETVRGLKLRHLASLASLLQENRRRGTLSPEKVRQHGSNLIDSAKQFVSAASAVDERAHAALFHALSFELAEQPAAMKSAAWAEARELQQKSSASGTPGTPPELFNFLSAKWGR